MLFYIFQVPFCTVVQGGVEGKGSPELGFVYIVLYTQLTANVLFDCIKRPQNRNLYVFCCTG